MSRITDRKVIRSILAVILAAALISVTACSETGESAYETSAAGDQTDQTYSIEIPEDALSASNLDELKSAIAEAASEGGQTVICLMSDIEQPAKKADEILRIPSGTDIRIVSAGSSDSISYSIRQTETQSDAGSAVIAVEGSLTLENVTVDANNCGRAVYVERGGTLTLAEGSVVTGGTTTSKNVNAGLGVYVAGCEAKGESFGTLIIEDGAAITGNTHAVSTYGRALGIGVYAGGCVVMNGGEISENTDTTDPSSSEPRAAGGAVYTKSLASAAASPWVLAGNSNFIMNGGVIRDNQAFAGGGIYASDYSTIQLNAGTISDNKAVYAGGALATDGNSGNTENLARLTVHISEGMTISGNQAEAGGAIYAGSGTLTIDGARINDNIAFTDEDSPKPSTTICTFASSGGSGGAIFMAQSEVELKNVHITGNTAASSVENAAFPVGNGGAVYVTNASNYIYPCILKVISGEISGNEASGDGEYAGFGGGICVGFEPGDESSFVPEVEIEGGSITDNQAADGKDIYVFTELTYKTRGYGGHDYGVGVQNGLPKIMVKDSAVIGEMIPSDYQQTAEGEDSGDGAGTAELPDGAETPADQEVPSDEYAFLSMSEYAAAGIPEGAVRVSDQAELSKAVQDQVGFIVFEKDITLVKPLTISYDLVLYGQGRTLSMDVSLNEDGVIRAEKGSLTIDGLRIDAGSKSRTVYVDTDAVLDISACVLTGRALTAKGLSIYNAGELSLENVLIQNAASASVTYQGVIYNCGSLTFGEGCLVSQDSYVYTGTVFNDGTFVMEGGTLSGTGSNSNRRKYGAAVTNNGEFIMSGGTITGCRNAEAVFSSGTFTMTGGKICDNVSTCLSGMTYNSVLSGGGVLIYGGSFEMYDGAEITGNTGYMGAGVGVYYTGSVFRMYGGLIAGNTAGIDPEESTFNENNGCGGGVGVYGGAEFEMLGGTISGNTAYIGDMAETSRMSGGYQTYDNTGLGGGIYVTEGRVTVSGGEISGNAARCAPLGDEGGLGGGIYIRDPGNGAAQVFITGGIVSGNTAEGYAGNDIFSGSTDTLTADMICLKVGGDAKLGDVWLSGNRLMLGVCSTLGDLDIASLCSEGRTSTGSAIVRYDDGAEIMAEDAEKMHFTGVADLVPDTSKRELIIGLIDLARVTTIEIDDIIFTGKAIDAASLHARMVVAEQFEIDAEGLAGLRAENMRNNTECGTGMLDLRGDSIRYTGTLKDIPFRILPLSLDSDGVSVEFKAPDAVYISDGVTRFTPEIRLILDSRSSDDVNDYLAEGPDGDYTVSYGDNISAGTGTIEIAATQRPGSNFTGSRTVTFEIFDRADAEKLELDYQEIYLPAGADVDSVVQISCSIYPEGAAGTDIIWTSSNEKVASVDENGMVTGLSCGEAVITAAADDAGGAKASCNVHVLFRDVAGSPLATDEDYQYYFEPVYWAVGQDIAQGSISGPDSSADTESAYFGVGEICSKGDFLIMLWKYSGRCESDRYILPQDVFEDMKDYRNNNDSDDELLKAAAWGYAEHIIVGSVTDGLRYLYPNVNLSRADMAVMLWRLAGRPHQYGKMKYSDVIDALYTRKSDLYQAVLWITKEGIAKGYHQDDGSSIFGLNKACNKEYAVTYLYRFDQLQSEE